MGNTVDSGNAIQEKYLIQQELYEIHPPLVK